MPALQYSSPRGAKCLRRMCVLKRIMTSYCFCRIPHLINIMRIENELPRNYAPYASCQLLCSCRRDDFGDGFLTNTFSNIVYTDICEPQD
ncbi:hypothetical protein CDAR_238721 [Caerostris darwini]|uniref:Uncharacterized protein n=1 Tax=Caerostris darwini TaxID=1538125 RepID=A0AAV4PRX2_9ARAC|nr:hypothetical protein CDAR_238721 [Caerostris darwini]